MTCNLEHSCYSNIEFPTPSKRPGKNGHCVNGLCLMVSPAILWWKPLFGCLYWWSNFYSQNCSLMWELGWKVWTSPYSTPLSLSLFIVRGRIIKCLLLFTFYQSLCWAHVHSLTFGQKHKILKFFTWQQLTLICCVRGKLLSLRP